MHAEGGTGPEHAVTICRSRNIFGPYENNFCNPILTHRHLGKDYPIKYVGHADMFETVNGEWYMVMLAVRPLEGFTTMGRETFLAKVTWENDWPVVNPGVGILTDEVEIDLNEWNPSEKNFIPGSDRKYDFTTMSKLGDEFLFLRNPGNRLYELDRKDGLKLFFRNITLKEQDSPAYVAVRQQHHSFTVSTTLATDNLTEGRRAGIALMQSNEFHLRAELRRCETGIIAQVIRCRRGIDEILCPETIEQKVPTIVCKVAGLSASLELLFEQEGETKNILLAQNVDIRDLSTEVSGGFVGCTVGMYAESDSEKDSEDAACFLTFSYNKGGE